MPPIYYTIDQYNFYLNKIYIWINNIKLYLPIRYSHIWVALATIVKGFYDYLHQLKKAPTVSLYLHLYL